MFDEVDPEREYGPVEPALARVNHPHDIRTVDRVIFA